MQFDKEFQGALQAHLPPICGGLCSLLSGATDEVIHVVLEAAVTLIKADGAAAVALEPAMMPMLLQVHALHER